MPLASLLEQTDFDADTTVILTTAFDQAWSQIKTTNAALSNDARIRTAVARRIIERAAGRRCGAVFAAVGLIRCGPRADNIVTAGGSAGPQSWS